MNIILYSELTNQEDGKQLTKEIYYATQKKLFIRIRF